MSRRQIMLGGVGLGLAVTVVRSLAACLPARESASTAATERATTSRHRIGYLTSNGREDTTQFVEAFRAGLADLGYVEGHNLDIEYRFADGDESRLPGLAAELVALPVEVLVPGALVATQAAQQATATIPIVFGPIPDPVAAGLVASLARPGGNLTGVTNNFPEQSGKQLELLKDALPTLSLVAVLYQATNPAHVPLLEQAVAAARALGVAVYPLGVRGPDELEEQVAAAIQAGAKGLIVFGGPFAQRYRAEIVGLVTAARLPAIYAGAEYARAGGLMAYGTNTVAQFRRKADYVHKLLRGAHPADLPVERPNRFDFVINLGAARAIGFEVPALLLSEATQVIE